MRRSDARWQSSAFMSADTGAKIPDNMTNQMAHAMNINRSPRCHECIKSATQDSTVTPKISNSGHMWINLDCLLPLQKVTRNGGARLPNMPTSHNNFVGSSLSPFCNLSSGMFFAKALPLDFLLYLILPSTCCCISVESILTTLIGPKKPQKGLLASL